MAQKKLRLGTRGSALALWQANWVKNALESRWSDLSIELITIKTTGDKILDVPLAKVGGKSLFTKEIDEALLDGRIDLAVHSMKDIPVETPPGLVIGAIPEREDPRDALVSRGHTLADLAPGATVGTSSLRRQSQLRHQFPSLKLANLRGNVDTRLRKLDAGEFDGIVLAVAGLKRLGHAHRITEILDHSRMVSAAGQGALGIVCRLDDGTTGESLKALDHPSSRTEVSAERALLRTLSGSCQVPIGARAWITEAQLTIKGLIASLDGTRIVVDQLSGAQTQADQVGRELGARLLASGGREILDEIARHGTPK